MVRSLGVVLRGSYLWASCTGIRLYEHCVSLVYMNIVALVQVGIMASVVSVVTLACMSKFI